MGLAAAKNKRKLGHDPNNTKWARKTDSYGQRLLRAQGWEPGQYLGAEGAAHAKYHTEASSSQIQVVLKDDNLGLGARRNNGDQCTGLDAFQHLLGRLNGKSEEVLESERKAREDVKLNLYVERKLGTIRFVSGGWLVGDELRERPTEKTESQPSSNPESTIASADEKEESKSAGKRSEKRKLDDGGDDEESKKASRKVKKVKKQKKDAQTDIDDAQDSPKSDSKRISKKLESEEGGIESEQACDSPSEEETSAVTTKEKRKEKKEKKDKKEKREKKKEKRLKKETCETGEDIEGEKKKKKKRNASSASDSEKASEAPALASLGSGVSTPSGSGYSTPIMGSSRYLARSRFIAQKKLAFTDTTALNQIFMIKS